MNNSVAAARWLAEVRLMRNVFPSFEPFVRQTLFGFAGPLRGKTGELYQVEIEAERTGYPAQAPRIYIRPPVGPNQYGNGALCVARTWRPHRDTFAQQVLYAADYLKTHG
jgi:hypothetical protein